MPLKVLNNKEYEIDKLITHKVFGIIIFFFVMFLMFEFTFKAAEPFMYLIEIFFSWLANYASSLLAGSPHWLISLVADSIIGGVGAVIVFFPNIFFLFLFMTFLEESGYMARATFTLDKFMSKLGLSSRSFVPLIIGFGCNVPAILASKTLKNKKDRLLTILITPFMSCSARLPIYVLFVAAFFSKYEGLVIFSLYLLGIITAVVMGVIFKKTLFKGKPERHPSTLPNYQIPSIRNMLKVTWGETNMFLRKAGTIIFSAVIVIWLLSNLPLGVEYASRESLIGHIGAFIAPVFAPLGFGFWEAGVALIFGLVAKEIVISTFGAVYGEAALTTVLAGVFTPLSAYAFMVFVLLYIPCIPTLAIIKKETNTKWMLFASIYLLIVAYIITLIVYQGGLLLLT